MKIHVARQGNRLGAFSLEDAKMRFQTGSLRANDLAWYEGAADWMPIAQVPGFEDLLSPLASSPNLPPPVVLSESLPLAGFWLRLLALLLDGLILLIPKALLGLVFFSAASVNHPTSRIASMSSQSGLIGFTSRPWNVRPGKPPSERKY
jgi:hypothetical protein